MMTTSKKRITGYMTTRVWRICIQRLPGLDGGRFYTISILYVYQMDVIFGVSFEWRIRFRREPNRPASIGRIDAFGYYWDTTPGVWPRVADDAPYTQQSKVISQCFFFVSFVLVSRRVPTGICGMCMCDSRSNLSRRYYKYSSSSLFF